jgi:uncharacterized membrane protein
MSPEEEIRQLRTQVMSLTERVYRLEQRTTAPSQTSAPPTPSQPEIAEPVTPLSAPVEMPRPTEPRMPYIPPLGAAPIPPSNLERTSLERRIGSQWLNRVGIIAVLVGVSYFLKLASDNGWIGPSVRVLIGLASGIALVWWSERFRRTQAIGFSYSLKAIGIGTLYLSLWASFQLYALVPAWLVFIGMVLVTASTAAMALWQHSELLAGLALLGGYLTPVLLSTGQNNEAVLLTYLALLAAGSIALQRFERWPRIVVGAWVGTLALYIAWANEYYAQSVLAETTFFVTLLFAIFAAAPFLASFANSRDDSHTQLFAILVVVNALAYFAELYTLHRGPSYPSRAALDAFILAGLYFGLGTALRRREEDAPAGSNVMWQVHQGLAITFLTISIALKLEGSWISFGWLVEAAGLYIIGARSRKEELKAFGAVVLGLALIRVVFLDSQLTNQTLLFNQRFGLFLLSIAVLAIIVRLEQDHPEYATRVAVAVIAINLLAVTALCLEVNDFFQAQRNSIYANQRVTQQPSTAALRALSIEEDFVYSAVLMTYGVGLMLVGFWKRTAFLRWQAIILVGITIAKVFLYDMSNLERIYRIASFIILGVILLAISYAYQKDWLGLQKTEH